MDAHTEAPPATNSTGFSHRLLLGTGRRAYWLLAAIILLNGISLLAPAHWLCELTVHFRLQYALLALALTGLFGLCRDGKALVAALLLLAWNASFLWPYFQRKDTAVHDLRALRLMVANVQTSNRDAAKLVQLVKAKKPHALLVMEVNERWLAALDELTESYPHVVISPREDNFGIALFCRLSLADQRVMQLGDGGRPSIFAEVDTPDGRFKLLGTHPLPPVSRRHAAARNRQLAAAADFVRQREGDVVVMGDLNITPWSPYFRQLLEKARLHDARRGEGVLSTWPSSLGPFGIPIDHVLLSEGLEAVSFDVEDSIGSDHRPITVDIRVRR